MHCKKKYIHVGGTASKERCPGVEIKVGCYLFVCFTGWGHKLDTVTLCFIDTSQRQAPSRNLGRLPKLDTPANFLFTAVVSATAVHTPVKWALFRLLVERKCLHSRAFTGKR